MDESILPIPVGAGISFNAKLGLFHQNWAAIDLHTDFAIYKFLGVTPLQAHLITTGMMFGRKARLLVDLIKHSDIKDKSKFLEPFNIIRGAARRDRITHSYIRTDATSVYFLERSAGNTFKAEEHQYTINEFYQHVDNTTRAAEAFIEAINASEREVIEFVKAALSLNRSEDVSDDP
jgi:hypothetical protein